ncbi:MAG: excinuclease ABC subunit B [Verrucomicrobia bacterium]|nr:MAG: excinuclease ABC subunit B [Verrucomicrobiota bacterium]
MLCMICKKNEAKVHFTQIVGGKVTKVDLCESCAKEKGLDDPANFSPADLLLGLGASEEIAQRTAKGDACPRCGLTQADFKKTGRLGCPDCYTHFAEGLEAALRPMHRGTRHVGKVPRQPRQPRPVAERIQRLQKQLELAVANEEFEEAARLRDEIKALRGETSSGAKPADASGA